jgi:hypothetical protein
MGVTTELEAGRVGDERALVTQARGNGSTYSLPSSSANGHIDILLGTDVSLDEPGGLGEMSGWPHRWAPRLCPTPANGRIDAPIRIDCVRTLLDAGEWVNLATPGEEYTAVMLANDLWRLDYR